MDMMNGVIGIMWRLDGESGQGIQHGFALVVQNQTIMTIFHHD